MDRYSQIVSEEKLSRENHAMMHETSLVTRQLACYNTLLRYKNKYQGHSAIVDM